MAAQQLGELVASPSAPQLPGPALICAVRALGALALQRAALAGDALPPLLALAGRVGAGRFAAGAWGWGCGLRGGVRAMAPERP